VLVGAAASRQPFGDAIAGRLIRHVVSLRGDQIMPCNRNMAVRAKARGNRRL
jgi:hypothetical protein